MDEDEYWIERVLTKLYALYLGGDLKYEVSYWDHDWSDVKSVDDNIKNFQNEIAALVKLSNIDVIEVDLISNIYKKDPEKQKVIKGEVKYLDYLPLLTGFNYDNFAEYCRLIGFTPHLKSHGLPRIEVDLGGGFRIHDRYIVSYGYKEIKLTPQTARVIAYIMTNSKDGRYTTSGMIIDEVYSNSESKHPVAEIRRVISEARQVFRTATGNDKAFFYSEQGRGYIFKAQ